MSDVRTLADKLKAAPTASDFSGKSLLLVNALGVLEKTTFTNISGMMSGFATRQTGFANILQRLGVYLCAVYSESDRYINCLFVVFMVKQDPVKNVSPHYILGSMGGLTLVSCNAYGTPAFKMTNGEDLPSDLVFRYLGMLC